MRRLTDKQQRFVIAVTTNGGNQTGAARLAGYAEHAKTGWSLMRDPKVLAAIREELDGQDVRWLPMAQKSILNIAKDPTHPDQFRACVWLLAVAGISPKLPRQQKKITEIEHHGNVVDEFRRLRREIGIDPRKLLGGAG